jgi:hypothetical protein
MERQRDRGYHILSSLTNVSDVDDFPLDRLQAQQIWNKALNLAEILYTGIAQLNMHLYFTFVDADADDS